MKKLSLSLPQVRQTERQLFYQALRFVAGNFFNSQIRNTRHFREWFRKPMNYARIMELPIAVLLLKAEKNDIILDVSSPKFLALYYAIKGFNRVVAADLEDYFISDFDIFRRHAKLAIDTTSFDVSSEIPYPDSYFDKIFSVSVLEHIPNNGDSQAIREMLRVLKPSGSIVITLPAFPHYVEEWTSTLPYWGGNVQNEDSKTFFQRRYDHNTLLRRFSIPDGVIREVILIAEKPIEPPRINKNGMMVHNSYLIDIFFVSRLLKMLGSHLRVPFSEYLAEFIVSRKHHYLTTEWTDPNIRQVAVKIMKVVNT